MAKKEKLKFKTEDVYSEILDERITVINVASSRIWEKCYKKDDLPKDFNGYCYSISFLGLKPVQLLKTSKAIQGG